MQARIGHGGGAARAVTAALLLGCAIPVVWAQSGDSQQAPAFRSGVELVTVDVGVVDRDGQPLRGLAASDFLVTVGGQPRRVVSAEFVDTSEAELAPRHGVAAISTNDGSALGRLFVFVVDANTLGTGSLRQVTIAAETFLQQLRFSDRSALMVMPLGPNLDFTWAHDRIGEALRRVVGRSSLTTYDFASLSEARDIANRQSFALRSADLRYCGGSMASTGSGAPSGLPGSPSSQSGGSGTSGGGSGGSGSPSSGQPAEAVISAGVEAFENERCLRDIQIRAESTWRDAYITSQASLAALRHVLTTLERVPGDKTVVLISGGWPIEESDHTSLLPSVAAAAANARATLYTLFAPSSSAFSVTRRTISSTPTQDQQMHFQPLETLASLTGGAAFRAEASPQGTFERLARELAGYYRLGLERLPGDENSKDRRLKVQVSGRGITVRAREIFDARTFEDRNWAARLASALEAPIPATGVGLRVTSYLGADRENQGQVRLVLAGEASRLRPGEVTFQVAVNDLNGKKLVSAEQPLGEPTGDGLRFSANVGVPPGSYIVRIAVMDSAGRVGSVDHRVEARPVAIGELSATGPVLVRVPSASAGRVPHFALDHVGQGERLALEVALEGDSHRLSGTDVIFEVAADADGPALVTAPGVLSLAAPGSLTAQAVTDVRVLPAGEYVARARVVSDGVPLGEVLRTFSLVSADEVPAVAADSAAGASARGSALSMPGGFGATPPFALDHVLAPQVLGVFLDRVAARPDASAPAVRDLLERARTDGIRDLPLSDASSDSAVAAFLQGLSLLHQQQLDAAADAFRAAMRASPDFYPAMVYLGACYAAGGKDKEAAGAWRTALIREGDALALHVLLVDAFLRQDRGDLALESLDRARARWPDDEGLKRRFAVASLRTGQLVDGLDAIEELIETGADDEPTLALALLVLYQGLVSGQPVESPTLDRARLLRFADAYRERGGPSLALVDTWVAAVEK